MGEGLGASRQVALGVRKPSMVTTGTRWLAAWRARPSSPSTTTLGSSGVMTRRSARTPAHVPVRRELGQGHRRGRQQRDLPGPGRLQGGRRRQPRSRVRLLYCLPGGRPPGDPPILGGSLPPSPRPPNPPSPRPPRPALGGPRSPQLLAGARPSARAASPRRRTRCRQRRGETSGVIHRAHGVSRSARRTRPRRPSSSPSDTDPSSRSRLSCIRAALCRTRSVGEGPASSTPDSSTFP